MKTRTLISFEKLPPDFETRTRTERIATLRAEMEEMGARLRRTLEDRASKLHVSGWVEDPNGITLYMPPEPDGSPGDTLVGTLEMTRPDDA